MVALTLKPLSLSSGFVLSEFASEFWPGASAHRFTKTQSECHLASALRLMNNPGHKFGLGTAFSILSIWLNCLESHRRIQHGLETVMFASRIVLTLVALASLTAIGVAHSGHGDSQDGNSLLHYVTSPMHLLPVLIAAIFIVGVSMFVRRSRRLTAVRVRR